MTGGAECVAVDEGNEVETVGAPTARWAATGATAGAGHHPSDAAGLLPTGWAISMSSCRQRQR